MLAARNLFNQIIRYYLAHSPITEGKKQLLKITKNIIYPQESIITFKTKDNFLLKVNLLNPEHEHLYFYGEHDERYEIKNIRKILRSGDVCWDIGANIGFYSCLFNSLIGDSGKVISFEPMPRTFEYLSENIKLNSYDNTVLINKALGDSISRVPIYSNDPDLAEGTASIKFIETKSHVEYVDMDTIDNLISEIQLPVFIKIDVEGLQKELFEGGASFFSDHDPIIMTELIDNGDPDAESIQPLTDEFGYTIFEFHKRYLKRIDDLANSRNRNFLLVKMDSPNFNRIRSLIRD